MHRRDPEATQLVLHDWMGTRLAGASDVTVTDLSIPAAGASNETMLFRAAWRDDEGEHAADLVLRANAVGNQLFLNPGVFFQWDMMATLAAHSDVPVPGLRWREDDPEVLGSPFFVMDRVRGEVPNGYGAPLFAQLTAEQVATMYHHALATLAQVHQVDWSHFEPFMAPGREPGMRGCLAGVADWYEWARAGRRFETIETGLGWLTDHCPTDAPATLLWGDARPGNMIIDPHDQAVTAVLDWELAGPGTPEADLGWWLMFERLFTERVDAPVPAGVPSRGDILTRYEGALGRPLRNIVYHDVLAYLRMAITCVRHIDAEAGGPGEAMFTDLLDYIIDNLHRTIGEKEGPGQ
jgi:aminoglycoside phosphotransferase (APT) family kinase protein